MDVVLHPLFKKLFGLHTVAKQAVVLLVDDQKANG